MRNLRRASPLWLLEDECELTANNQGGIPGNPLNHSYLYYFQTLTSAAFSTTTCQNLTTIFT